MSICKILLICLVSIFAITFIKAEINLRTDSTNLKFLTLICPSGSTGISWYSTYLVGKSLDKATNTNDICLSYIDGIARYNDNYNYLTCLMYNSSCGQPKTSNIREDVCNSYSKYEKNAVMPDRIIYSAVQKPDLNEIKNFGKTILIVVADLGSSTKLKQFYDSLPSECKRHLDLTFDI